MKRLAIVSTHPIQYNAPLFQLLAADEAIDLKVFYSKQSEEVRYDKDFDREVKWDIPLTNGYECASFRASAPEGLNKMVNAIDEFAPDALLVFGWNFPGHLATMRRFKGHVPIWFRGDSTLLDPMSFWKRFFRKLVLTLVYRSVDRAFYVGKANKRYFLWAGLKEEQLTYAPHAVDNGYFQANDEERNKLAAKKRKELGIASDATVFLFVGKLEPKKQPDFLGKAFLTLENKEAHLIFIGSGILENKLKAEFDTVSNIHFVGFQNQQAMPIWYRVGNVICMPSKGPGETWGLAVNEGLNCGCEPLVSTRAGCCENLVKPDFQLPPDSMDRWREAMSEFIETRNAERPDFTNLTNAHSYEKIQNAIRSTFDEA